MLVAMTWILWDPGAGVDDTHGYPSGAGPARRTYQGHSFRALDLRAPPVILILAHGRKPDRACLENAEMSIRNQSEARYTELLSRLRSLQSSCDHAIGRYRGTRENEAEHLFILMLARAVDASRALELLFVNGHGADAGSVLRTIGELYIELLYLRRPGMLERFFDYQPIHNEKMAANFCRIYPEKTREDYWRQYYESRRELLERDFVSWNALAEYQAQAVEDAKAKHDYGAGWADSRGSRVSTERKARLVDGDAQANRPESPGDALLAYNVAFRFGSLDVHPSHASLQRYLQKESPRSGTVSSGPFAPHDKLPLIFGYLFLMRILDQVNDALELGAEDDLRTANEWMKALAGASSPEGS